jgi:hypothetical protein
MGFGIVLFIYLIMAVVLFLGASVVCWILYRLPQFQSRFARITLRLTPIGVALLPLALFLGSILWMNIAPAGYLYGHVFGIEVSDSIKDLRSSSSATNDAQEIFLAFAASKKALARTLTTSNFTDHSEADKEDFVPLPPGDDKPTWWKADRCKNRSVYTSFKTSPPADWDDIVVTHCREDKTIYVQARWVH